MAKLLYEKYPEEKQRQIAQKLGVGRITNMFTKDAYYFDKKIFEIRQQIKMDLKNNKNKNKNIPSTTSNNSNTIPTLPSTPQTGANTNNSKTKPPPSTTKRIEHQTTMRATEPTMSTNNANKKNRKRTNNNNDNTVNTESISKGICARPSDTNEQTKKALNKCNLRNRFVFIYIHCNKFIVVYILYGFICKLHGFIIQNIC